MKAISLICVALCVALLLPSTSAQVAAPVPPTGVPAEWTDFYNFIVQTGGNTIIKLGDVLGNYLDLALISAIGGVGRKKRDTGESEHVVRKRAIKQMETLSAEVKMIEGELEALAQQAFMLSLMAQEMQPGVWSIPTKKPMSTKVFNEMLRSFHSNAASGNSSSHRRVKRQLDLGSVTFNTILGSTLNMLFTELKLTLGQFTYMANQLLGLYQVLPTG